jgi:hypothetical protein
VSLDSISVVSAAHYKVQLYIIRCSVAEDQRLRKVPLIFLPRGSRKRAREGLAEGIA